MLAISVSGAGALAAVLWGTSWQAEGVEIAAPLAAQGADRDGDADVGGSVDGAAAVIAPRVAHQIEVVGPELLTFRDYFTQRYPGRDLATLGKSSEWFDRPLREQSPWDEVAEEALQGVLAHYHALVAQTDREVLERALGVSRYGTIANAIAKMGEKRGLAPSHRGAAEIDSMAHRFGGRVVDAVRARDMAFIAAGESKFWRAEIDVFDYLVAPDLVQHSQPQASTLSTGFYAGKGWVVLFALHKEDVPDHKKFEELIDGEIEGLLQQVY